MIRIPVIGSASSAGINILGSEEGPQVISQSQFNRTYADKMQLTWREILYPDSHLSSKMDIIQDVCARLAKHTSTLVLERKKFVVIGGDHSCAVGTWSGASVLGKLGLIWIDAHLDSHTPDTSLSGNIHGMPLASLLGHGDHRLTQLFQAHPKLLPEHTCIIGARSYEEGELALVKQLGIRVFYFDEVASRGIGAVFQEARQIVTQGTQGYGLSIDLDGIDPQDAPGVSTPAPFGFAAKDFCDALQTITEDSKLLGIEIVEFNPHYDHDHRTEKLIFDLIQSAFLGKNS